MPSARDAVCPSTSYRHTYTGRRFGRDHCGNVCRIWLSAPCGLCYLLVPSPCLPPIGRCIRSGLVHTNQSVINAVPIRESWSSNIEGLPANAVRIFLRRLCIFDTLYVIGRIFDGLFVIGRLGDFERIVLLFQQGTLHMLSPMEIAFDFFPGLEGYDYMPEFLIFRIFGIHKGNAAEHSQHNCCIK